MSIIIGIDPGLTMTGVAAYDTETGKFLDVEAFKARGEGMSERISFLVLCLGQFTASLGLTKPHIQAIEDNHVNPKQGVQSALKQREVIGAFSLRAGERGLREVRVSPTEGKRALTGKGSASKADMVRQAQKLLDLSDLGKEKKEAVADAMGVCLASLNKIILG